MILVSQQRDIISPITRRKAEWPSTIREQAPAWDGEFRCARFGRDVPEAEWDEILADGDSIHFYRMPGLITVPFAPAVVTFLNQLGLAIAFSVISRLLMPAKKPNKRDEEDSANNGWSNLQSNDRFEGVPMPVIYGRHREAGAIINQVVRTSLDGNGNPVSELSLLLLLCDGQIQAVGDKTADGGPFLNEDGTFVKTLQLNNQPAENFEDIEAHVRLGTDENEAIPGFANAAVQYGIGQSLTFPRSLHKSPFTVIGARALSGTLTGYTNNDLVTVVGGTGTAATFRLTVSGGLVTAALLSSGGSYTAPPSSPNSVSGGTGLGLQIELDFDSLLSAVGDSASDPTGSTNSPGANTAIAGTGVHAATSTNITKWDNFGTPVAYTMGEEADEFSLLFDMPQGLGDFTGANSAPNTVAYQVRYREVDAVGVPFGSYIVLDAERLTLARSRGFKIEYRRRFYSTIGYAPPSIGGFLRGRTGNNGTTNRGASLALNAAAVPSRSKANSDFSFSCWVRPNFAISPGAGTTAIRTLFNWLASNKGFRLDIEANNTDGLVYYGRFLYGDGTTTRTKILGGIGALAAAFTDTTNFTHLAVVYEGDGLNATNGRVKIYVNGVLRANEGVTGQAEFDAAVALRVQAETSPSPTQGFNCDMDEPVLWSKALSAFDVARLYNNRAPLSVDATADGLLAGGRFDGTSGTTGRNSIGPAGGALWTLGDGTGTGSTANPDCSFDPTSEVGIVKSPEAGAPKRSRYLIEVQRLTVEDERVGLQSEIGIETIELTSFQEYCYPGCALLAVKMRATDQLSGGSPLVTVRVDGRLVPVWDGADAVFPNMEMQWSRNPAWIAVDILTNQDYGLGNLYSYSDIDLPAFKDLADYCDELVYDNGPRILVVTLRRYDALDGTLPTALQGGTQDFIRYRVNTLPPNWPALGVTSGRYMRPKITGTVPSIPAWIPVEAAAAAQEIVYTEYVATGSGFYYVWSKSSVAFGATEAEYTPAVSSVDFIEIEGHDVRYRYDGVFDRADVPAWDAVNQVLQVARAVPIKLGRRVSVFIDKPASPVALIGMGNIIEGTFRASIQGVSDRPNVEQAEFFDEELNFERSFVTDELPDVTDPSKQSAFNFRRVRLEGVTRRGQAKRHLRRDLNAFKLLRRMKSFETGINGLSLLPGEVFGLSHDVPGYGISGRLLNDSANATTVKLDRAVTLAPATSYQIQVEDATSGTRETKPITSVAGTYAAGVALTVGGGGFSFTPGENDIYALGVVGAEAQLYRVIESTLDPLTLRRKIKALEYNEDVYSDDFGELPETSPTSLPVPSAPTIPSGVENLVVGESVAKGPDGHTSIGADVSFVHASDTFANVAGSDVYVSIGTHDVGRQGAIHVASLDRSVTATRLSYPFERDRTYTIWVVPRARSGAHYRAYASYSEFTPTGLSAPPPPPRSPRVVVAGEQAFHQWSDDGDGELDHGATVEVRQGGWILGLKIASAPAQSRRTMPVGAWASAPTNSVGAGTPQLVARTKSRTGQYSEAVLYDGPAAANELDGEALSVSQEESW